MVHDLLPLYGSNVQGGIYMYIQPMHNYVHVHDLSPRQRQHGSMTMSRNGKQTVRS